MVQLIKFNLSIRQLLLVIAGLSSTALMSAYIAQYGFKIYPCHLCYYHRAVYAVVIVLSLAAAVKPVLNRCIERMFLGALWLACATGIGVAGYHVGVEHKWIEPPRACLNAYMDGNSLEEVKAEIMNEPVVPCDRVAWSMFGLSMTDYSLLLFLLLLALTTLAIRRHINGTNL
jgi:disulfide bond formation protein DsbB